MKLLMLDTETTGLDPLKNGVIQIAGIIDIDGEVKEEFNFRVRPFKGDIIDLRALEVNGVSRADLEGFDAPEAVYERLRGILTRYVDRFNRKDKFYAVGQNIGFDIGFLREFFRKNKDIYFGSFVHYQMVDLIPISVLMKLAGRVKLDNFKLATVMQALGESEQTHDALHDVRAVRKIFYEYVSWVRVGKN